MTSRNPVGRPRRGTEIERTDMLIAAATRVFLRDGYGSASIDKVATEAGVSTRTIYERVRNKADLLGTVISRLAERDMATVFAADQLDRLTPRQALMAIGQIITRRASDPDSAALFRIVATEAPRFPELAARVRSSGKQRLDAAVAAYFRGQVLQGALKLADPDRAASLFLQMVCADVTECLLFGSAEEMRKLDYSAHLNHVVEIFLDGALPRDEVAEADCQTTPGDPPAASGQLENRDVLDLSHLKQDLP